MSDPVPKIRALHMPEAQFVCEQDGDAERDLKARWVEALTEGSGVRSAYLARVRYGDSTDLTVALCIRVSDGSTAKPVIERCAGIFATQFGPDQALDILVLSGSQEAAIQLVCPAFFRDPSPSSVQSDAPTAVKKPNPIVWFELQMAPAEFRLAVVAGQPILFGYGQSQGDPGKTWLLRTKENPEAAKAVALGLAEVIRANPIYKAAPNEPEKCFQAEALKLPSLHVRIAWADGKRWGSYYRNDSIPESLQNFVHACRKLGMDKIASLHSEELTGEEALREVKSRGQSH